ncbi:hypothetical protein [uncultured Friedmanniella sp.]|uniref:hypothetical protein n=1 Tax=uncultured Friedmanniella sp. TaxID=335381 RepID=UPI0035CC9398
MSNLPPPPVLLARDLVAQGYRYSDLRQLARRGELQHLRRGAYSRDDAELGEESRHRQLVAATMPMLSAAVVSHVSAAVLYGLPVPPGPLDHVQVTSAGAASGRRGHVHRYAAPLAEGEIAVVAGLPVTSLARTVVDLGRTLPFADAVAAADAALRTGLDRTEVEQVLARAAGRPGVATARRVVAFADARSESAGESHSRVVLHAIGLPPSSLQYEVVDANGRVIARCDFGWEEHRTVGEFDGLVKYGRLLKPGQTVGEVVHGEKHREDSVRDLGYAMVRWGSSDLQRERVLGDRLRRAFARAR